MSQNSNPQILKEYEDYFILPDPTDEQAYLVRIDSGYFQGITFKYDKIQIIEEDDGSVRIVYGYDIIKKPEGDTIISMDDFEICISNILHSILYNATSDAVALEDEDGNTLPNTNLEELINK